MPLSADDDAKLVDELGDLLFQTFFLALLIEERGAGDLAAGRRGDSREARAPPSACIRGRDGGHPRARSSSAGRS
jgi:hypothetical protein